MNPKTDILERFPKTEKRMNPKLRNFRAIYYPNALKIIRTQSKKNKKSDQSINDLVGQEEEEKEETSRETPERFPKTVEKVKIIITQSRKNNKSYQWTNQDLIKQEEEKGRN